MQQKVFASRQKFPEQSAAPSHLKTMSPQMPTSFDRQSQANARLAQLRQQLETRIDRLPDQVRTVFMLRGVEALSQAETALALELPQATVQARFLQARSLLREGLAQDVDKALADAFSGPAGQSGERTTVAAVLDQIPHQRDGSTC
jgi:RNA polymerase sigma-70 factor (ECF subfamily)